MNIPPPPKKKGNAKLAALEGLATGKGVQALTEKAPGRLVALNLKVKPEIKRRLKLFAAETDTTMVDIVDKALTAYMENH